MKNTKSMIKTLVVIAAVFAAFWVGVAKAQQVFTYKCGWDGYIAQSSSFMPPTCPQCGHQMMRQ